MDEKQIFLSALELESPQRQAEFLDQACGQDKAFRERIETLLRSHSQVEASLTNPQHATDATPEDPTPPSQEVSLAFLAASQRSDSLGRLGGYEILEVLGQGGMGVVLRALDVKLNRVVAVKVLAPELAANATARKRFLREAQAAAAIAHPHVVTIHAVDDQHKTPLLVMEYVDGKTLLEKIEHEGALELVEILRIGGQIAQGLAAAHDQGLIHRDVKPANILLENSVGRVKITDFGLARAVDDFSITRIGEVAGTPEFMSPEQAQGHRLDHRSDLFSLGSVLYTMCTGRTPFRADSTIAILRRVCDDVARPIREANPEVPDWLAEIVGRLLKKNPDDRFQSAREVAELLARRLASLQNPPAALPPTSPKRPVGEAGRPSATPSDANQRLERHDNVSFTKGAITMTSQRAVGIDLGTTYSVAAWVDGSNRTAVIANSEGDILTPSAVVFEEHDIIVGKQAGKLGVMKADRLAECVKRDMGNPFYSRPIDGEFLPPEVIQACVLKKIHQDVTEKIGPDFRVVITVPAFFDDSRRRATAIAGEIAGLDVLDIVNEPMAGALAFGEHLDALHSLPAAPQDLKVLVYDLGGGTFDATLLSINQSAFRTLATDGDVRLGGRDWDQRLVDMACEQFIRRFREDPRQNPVSLQRLLAEVERAKQTLSARPRAVVRVDHAGNSLETQVTRDAFEERTADLLERTAHTTRELLVTAGLEWKHVSRILLVGGATRMPMVSKMLEELSGVAADYVVSPDEAVARGAAIYAKHLLDAADGSPSKFQITNVNAHNLGIQGIEQATQQKVNAVLISRNTPLPVKTTRRFVTRRADQRSIAILVLEGESPLPSECTVIGRSVIEDLPRNLPQGHPIEVTYEYAANARLSVRASLPSVDRDVRIEIERGARLPDDGIGQWKKAVSGGRGLAVLRKVLNRQAKGEKRPWKQLSVTYDDVLVGPEQRDEEGRLGEGPLRLEPTTQTVPAANADPAEDAAAAADSITAAYRRPPRVRKRRRQKSPVLEVLKFVGGGVLGLAIGQMVIWWVLHRDPFDSGPAIPPPFNVIVPKKLRQVSDGGELIENSTKGEAGQPSVDSHPPRSTPSASDGPSPGASRSPTTANEPSRAEPPSVSDTKSPFDEARFKTTLVVAWGAMGDRDLVGAESKLEAAQGMVEGAADPREHREEVKRLKLFHLYLADFYEAFTKGLRGLNSGDEIMARGQPIAVVVEVADGRITIRYAGRNLRYAMPSDQDQGPPPNMPRALIMAIADRWLDESTPGNDVFRGAFLAVDAEGDPDEARRLWRHAASAGIKNVDALSSVLDDYAVSGMNNRDPEGR